MDHLQTVGADKNRRIGSLNILPFTFTGGERYMRQNFLDAMTLVKNYGKPDRFITFTGNPK